MKKCQECGVESPDEVEKCDCGSTSFRALAAPDAVSIDRAFAPRRMFPRPPADAKPAEGEAGAESEAREEPAAEPADPEAADEEEAADGAQARPADGQPPPRPGGQGAAGQSQRRREDLIRTVADLDKVRKDNLFVMGLLGFPTGGKTWFLNRLKHTYVQAPDRRKRLRARPHCTLTPGAVPRGTTVRRSNEISRHRFTFPSREKDSFNLLDIPGEKFAAAALDNFVGVTPHLLETLKLCDAIIVVLPADELLFAQHIAEDWRRKVWRAVLDGRPPEDSPLPPTDDFSPWDLQAKLDAALERQKRAPKAERPAMQDQIDQLQEEVKDRREWHLALAANQIEDFVENLGLMAGVLHLLKRGKSADEIADMEGSEIMGQVGRDGYRKHEVPLFLAISKMDMVIDPDPWLRRKLDKLGVDERRRQHLDRDPLDLMGKWCPGLERQAFGGFAHCRIDCVTAFEGHSGNPDIAYSSESYGVEAVVDWIQWARAFAKKPARTRWATTLAHGLRRVRVMGAA